MQAKKSFWGKKPGFDVGDILHIAVNLGFVTVLYAMVAYWGLAILAVFLVVLSKWRVLAVQPRFWLPNIKANLVDVIVGVSTVMLTQQSRYTWVAVLWMASYAVWLLFLKPKSQDIFVGLQSLWAQLLGILALFMVGSFIHHAFLVCLLAWVVAWSCARHYFSNYEEPHYRTLGLLWGFLISQLVWISLHWIQYYVVFGMNISITAIIITIISASLGSIYHAYKNNALHRGILLENGLFAGALLLVVLVTASWKANF